MFISIAKHMISLRPFPRYSLRGLLVLSVSFGSMIFFTWPLEVIFPILAMVVFGTYGVVHVSEDYITETRYFAFLPIRHRRISLEGMVSVHPEWVESAGLMEVLFLWFWEWLVTRVYDATWPMTGGRYQVFLRWPNGGKYLAWRGSNRGNFRTNLRLLSQTTGLPIS